MIRVRPLLVCLASSCLFACNSSSTTDLGMSDDASDPADLGGVDVDLAEPDLSTGPTVFPSPHFDGEVEAIVHVPGAWILGGAFTRTSPHFSPGLIALDTSGAVSSCDLGRGFVGEVLAVATAGNDLYVGGNIGSYDGRQVRQIAKLDRTTCALDTTFNPTSGSSGFTGGAVNALLVEGDYLYVGGGFSAYRAAPAARIAKIHRMTGVLDTTFSPSISNGFDADVQALASDGTSLFVGGNFTAYRGVANSARGIAKLALTTGDIDLTFSPVGATSNGFDGSVVALHVSGDSLYVGGTFGQYRNAGMFSALCIAKVAIADGTLDTTFSPPGLGNNGFNGYVLSMTTSGGALYVGGNFNSYRGASTTRYGVTKLDATTGALDAVFTAGPGTGFDTPVRALTVVGGSIYTVGEFAIYDDVPLAGVAKLDATTGALDQTFKPQGETELGFAPGRAYAVAAAGSQLWVGGDFTLYGGFAASHLIKIDDTTRAIDTSFTVPAILSEREYTVRTLLVSGSSLYVGGQFENYLAKLDLNGAVDTTFTVPGNNGGFNDEVLALAADATHLYAGGRFDRYRGVVGSAHRVAKLDLSSGAIDTTFSPPGTPMDNGFNALVRALAVAGTSLYVGGEFTTYRNEGANAANRVAKLDTATGALETIFSPAGFGNNGFDARVATLSLSGSTLFAGGGFTNYRGGVDTALGIAKLDATSGVLDVAFSPPGAGNNGFDSPARVVLATSSAIWVGGDFTDYRGANASAGGLAKLDPVSGAQDVTVSPPGVDLNGVDGSIYAMVAGTFGGADVILIGGRFSGYRGEPAGSFAILDATTGAPR